jgi:hypothetical protein
VGCLAVYTDRYEVPADQNAFFFSLKWHKNSVFWDVKSCTLCTGKCLPTFRKTILRASLGLFNTENGDTSLSRNVGNYVLLDKTQYSGRCHSSIAQLSEPPIAHFNIMLYLHAATLFALTLFWPRQMFNSEIKKGNL